MPEPRRENLSIQVDGGKCRFEQDLTQNISDNLSTRQKRGKQNQSTRGEPRSQLRHLSNETSSRGRNPLWLARINAVEQQMRQRISFDEQYLSLM